MIPAGPPRSLPVVQPPNLCEAGPCRHYHRVASVMDAEDGGMPGQAHRQITRACYPAPGIELEIGETPVLQCSRWEPDDEQGRLDILRAAFLKKPSGKAFAAKVTAFEESEAAHADAESAEAGGGLTGIDSDLADVSDGDDELGEMIVDEAVSL